VRLPGALTVIVFLLGAASRASAAECRATAVVDGGDAALVDAVDAALARRGIATRVGDDSCPPAKVRVERRTTTVWVSVTDPHGRSSERTLVDVEAAASLVESWARPDMNAAALLGWVEPAPAVAPAPAARDSDNVERPRGTAAHARDRILLGAGGEASRAIDATSWVGARVSACIRVRSLCAGLAARGAWITSGIAARDVVALATLDATLALAGRVALSAGIGAGAGQYATEVSVAETTTTHSHTSIRLDARVELAVEIAPHVSLHLGISAESAPQASSDFDLSGDATRSEPSGFIRGDLGLRIGVR